MRTLLALRARAARIDADFAKQEVRAETRLHKVRKRNRKSRCCGGHAFATAEIVIRDGCLCGDFCRGAGQCAGLVVRRLRPVPDGFVEVTA
jgi:hypothetical protein